MTRTLLKTGSCNDYKLNMPLYIHDLRKENSLTWACLDFMVSEIADTTFAEFKIDNSIKKNLNKRSIARFLDMIKTDKEFNFRRDYNSFVNFYILNYLNPEYYLYIFENDYVALLNNLIEDKPSAWKVFETLTQSRVRNSKLREVKNTDARNDIMQDAKIEFWNVLKKGINLEKYNNLTAIINLYLRIVYYKTMDYFRAVKVESPLKDLEKTSFSDDGDEIITTNSSITMEESFIDWKVFAFEKGSDPLKVYSYFELREKELRKCEESLNEYNSIWYQVYILKTCQNKKHKEIADILNKSATTSQNLLADATKLIRNCMKSKGFN